MYSIEVDGHFDAAHFLTNYHGKCENLHGHRYHVIVTLTKPEAELAQEGTQKDMVQDFTQAKKTVQEICEVFDHTFLVEKNSLKPETIKTLEGEGFTLTELPFRTTAENLAKEIFNRCKKAGLPVTKVEVDETPKNRAIYQPQ